jgi:RNA polymerase sigma-70 factor (ECF subfamily)
MDFTPLSDEDIIHLFRKNPNHKAFAELVRRHQNTIIKQCKKQIKDPDVTQDISQEVWIRVLTKAHQFRAESSFSNWLKTIVHNRCIDHINKNKQALHQEISQKIVDTLEEEIDTEQIPQPTTEILKELLEKISGEEKLILLLKYEQRWSIKAIQQALNLEESTVKQRLKRSRDKLQKLLDQYSKDGGKKDS